MEDEELSAGRGTSENEEEDNISWMSLPSPRQPQFDVGGPFPFGRSDLEKLVQRNDKTRAVEDEADASIQKLMRNANAYVLEMKLLEDIENVLKETNTKKQPLCTDLVKDLLEDDNWLKTYGLESSEELQETYSQIKQNILTLFSEIPVSKIIEDQEEILQEETPKSKDYQLKRAFRCMKQATNHRRPLSTSAIEGPSHFLPNVHSRRAKPCRVLPHPPKKGQSKSCCPRGFSSEEVLSIDGSEVSRLTSLLESCSEDDEQYQWPILDGGSSVSPRRSPKELIDVNNAPST